MVVAFAPIVADPFVSVDDHRVHVELDRAGGDAETGLPGTDDNDPDRDLHMPVRASR